MIKTMKRPGIWRRPGVGFIIFALLMGAMGISRAATPPSPAPDVLTISEAAAFLRVSEGELEQLAAQNKIPGRRMGEHWRFNRAALLAWLNGDWTLIATAAPPSTNHGSAQNPTKPTAPVASLSMGLEDMARVTATGTSAAQGKTQVRKYTEDANDEEPIGEAPEERTAEELFLRGQKVLLAPGEVTVDIGQFFTQIDNHQLASVGTGIGLATIDQETFTTTLLGRVGVSNETEVFASTSYRNQTSDVFIGSTRIAENDRSEFGDIRLGIRRTLLKEGPGRPDIIVTLDGRIPTGDTSKAIGGGVALVKSIDPAVLFFNANYRHTFSRDFSDLTRLEPEDRLDVTMGYALALNDTLTISTSFSGLFSSATSFDNARLRQQDSYSLSLGLTAWLAEGLYIEPTLSFGLNGPSDSFAFGVTVPYRF